MSMNFSTVGRSVPPIYGVEKATGALRFPADINLPNMLWMKILRSPHAHAKIVAVDATAAEKMPGVAAVISHKDVPRVLFGPYQNEIYPLDEEVRFVGDTVAAVAAKDWNVAEEAIRTIRVTYKVLPAVHDPESGVEPGAPRAVLHYPERHELKPGDIRPDQLGTFGNVIGLKEGGPTVVNERGDVEKGFAQSDVVIEKFFRQSEVNAVSHEPRAGVAVYENDTCTLWCSVQDPYRLQESTARVLGLPMEAVRVISTNLGGAFGVKVTGRFAVLCALLARKTGQPVKIWFTREEESLDSHNRSALTHSVIAGVNRDGSLIAIKVRTFLDNGYWPYGGLGQNIAFAISTRPIDLYHRCPNVKWEVFAVRTNHPSTGPYRGRADAESHFPIESVMDELACAIQMDPIEFRLKNRLHEGDDLCSAPTKIMSTVWLEEAARAGAEKIGWQRRSFLRASSRGARKKGMGMAMVIHSCGSNPAGISEAEVKIDDRGKISLFSGTADQGSEQQTTLRQMVAEVLGVSLVDLGGSNADTSSCPFDSGPFSSRTVYATGIAATRAAEEIKKNLLEHAAVFLSEAATTLDISEKSIWKRSDLSKRVGFDQLAKLAGGSISGKGTHNAKEDRLFAYGFAAAFAEVEVDVETGEVKILRLVSSHDVGRAINPMIVEGQILGGAAQGLGYALSEGFYFDQRTGTALNQWFLDLRTPSILDLPDIEPVMVELGEPTHPFGAKGCSEISYVGVAPAVANAIFHATGARVTELPMTPDVVLKALRNAKESVA
ncbi:MAG TPA: xanthine dehydrogenase family protein molybdopterin-binding subunit [Candidatus Binatia bacterium]|nr:xanthine dehydrogenase family protein molybdopterin-binding subunit [Candidatus Binatia bacterium]